MKLFTAFASVFLAASAVSANDEIDWTDRDDPRCHVNPEREVLEPSPSPTPFPPPLCEGLVTGYTLYNANTQEPIPGYVNKRGEIKITLSGDSSENNFNIRAEFEDESAIAGVRWYWKTTKIRDDLTAPFTATEDSGSLSWLKTAGTYYVIGLAKETGSGKTWESKDIRCDFIISVEGEEDEEEPPTTVIETIDRPECTCCPEEVVSEAVGQLSYITPPIKLTDQVPNVSTSFKIKNTVVNDVTVDWMTAAYVTPGGIATCDMTGSSDYDAYGDHVYDAKCFDGFAYVDLYFSSESFENDNMSAWASTSDLPAECKGTGSKVVKYTFVMPCDCENEPEVPPEIIGEPNPNANQCVGTRGHTWGDPHITAFDGLRWNCQGDGEFVLMEAELENYDYDFEIHSRFHKFDIHDLDWSFNTGVAIQADVKVSMFIAPEANALSQWFGNIPVNFYVDGEQRALSDGSGDHRVKVWLQGLKVTMLFVGTGIEVKVDIRPYSLSRHIIEIPGSFSVFVCLPETNPYIKNVNGLLGIPDHDPYNDWTTRDGQEIAYGGSSDSYNYCTDNWCVKDETKSLFEFEPDYDFTYYNRCDLYTNTAGDVDLSAASDEVKAICAELGADQDSCLMEGIFGGTGGAELAVEAIKALEAAKAASMAAAPIDESACCSLDYKTCSQTCANNNKDTVQLCHECVSVGQDAAFWLQHGTYDTGPLANCFDKNALCNHDAECCPGLDCDNAGKCQAPKRPNSRRHLESMEFRRPDLDGSIGFVSL